MDRETTKVASKLIHQRQQSKNHKHHVQNLRNIHNVNTRSTNFQKQNLKTYNVFYHIFSKDDVNGQRNIETAIDRNGDLQRTQEIESQQNEQEGQYDGNDYVRFTDEQREQATDYDDQTATSMTQNNPISTETGNFQTSGASSIKEIVNIQDQMVRNHDSIGTGQDQDSLIEISKEAINKDTSTVNLVPTSEDERRERDILINTDLHDQHQQIMISNQDLILHQSTNGVLLQPPQKDDYILNAQTVNEGMMKEIVPQMTQRTQVEVQSQIYKYQTTFTNQALSSFYNAEQPQLKRKMFVDSSRKNLKNDLRRRSEIATRSKQLQIFSENQCFLKKLNKIISKKPFEKQNDSANCEYRRKLTASGENTQMHTQIANLKKLRAQYSKDEDSEYETEQVKPIPTHKEVDMKMQQLSKIKRNIRFRQQQDLNDDNMKQFNRLINQQSCYKYNDWMSDSKKNEGYMKRIIQNKRVLNHDPTTESHEENVNKSCSRDLVKAYRSQSQSRNSFRTGDLGMTFENRKDVLSLEKIQNQNLKMLIDLNKKDNLKEENALFTTSPKSQVDNLDDLVSPLNKKYQKKQDFNFGKLDTEKPPLYNDKVPSKLGQAAMRYKQQRMEFKVLESNIERKKRMINKLCVKDQDSVTQRITKLMNHSKSKLESEKSKMNKSSNDLSFMDKSFRTSLFGNFSQIHTDIKQMVDQKPIKYSIEKFQRSKSRDHNNRFGNISFSSQNLQENVHDIDFEKADHPFTQRRILFKKGIELEFEQGFYLIEISKSNKFLFVVAYDVQNMGVKYIKHLNVEQGLEMLKNYQYNIDEIAKNIRINVRKRKLYLNENYRSEVERNAYNPMSMSQRMPRAANQDLAKVSREGSPKEVMTPETASAYNVGNLCDAPEQHLSFGIGSRDGKHHQNIDVIQEIPSLAELPSVASQAPVLAQSGHDYEVHQSQNGLFDQGATHTVTDRDRVSLVQ